MLDSFQSPAAIQAQITDNFEYYFLVFHGKKVGYICVKFENSKLFLSKIYVKKEFRKKGIARFAFARLEQMCKSKNLTSIYLNVNKNNQDSILAYKKIGFKIIKSTVVDIGEGFVLDDYIIEKAL